MANCSCFGRRRHWPESERAYEPSHRRSAASNSTASANEQQTAASDVSDEFQYLPEPLSDPGDDFYTVLGITRDADAEEVKRAYKAKALKWHPDKNMACRELAERQFKFISEAYQVLSDPEKRKRYDIYGKESVDDPLSASETAHPPPQANRANMTPVFAFTTNPFSNGGATTFTFFNPGVPTVHYGHNSSYPSPRCCSGFGYYPSCCSGRYPATNLYYSTSCPYTLQYPMTYPNRSSCPECDIGPSPKYRNRYRCEGNCQLNRSNIHYPSSRATEI